MGCIIAVKKIKGDGVYFVGNNANDVTGSCIYIKFNGKKILLECGLIQTNCYLDNYRLNSEKFAFQPSEIDYVFLPHVHQDHIGLVPRLVKEGFNGKIITTHTTASLMKDILLNGVFIIQSEASTLSRIYKREYTPIYTEEDVMKTLSLVYEYEPTNMQYKLDDVVSFEWLSNSHCLGSRQLRLNLVAENGVTKHILYTSDIGALKATNHYVPDVQVDERHYDIAIMESTYGDSSRTNKKTRKFDVEHLKVAIETVLERGGTFIMPCFSFSRTQEILTVLFEIFGNTDWDYPVIVDSKLSCQICDQYDELLYSGEIWNEVRNWKNVHFVSDKEDSIGWVKNHIPKVVISSSGFCTNGRILSYLHEYLTDVKSMVAFSGYVGSDNSYLSYRIKNYKENKTIKISGDELENKADCISLTSFSSHANYDDLVQFGSSLNTNKLVLVHGSTDAKNCLKSGLQTAISKKDKAFKVLCSTKDMSIRL